MARLLAGHCQPLSLSQSHWDIAETLALLCCLNGFVSSLFFDSHQLFDSILSGQRRILDYLGNKLEPHLALALGPSFHCLAMKNPHRLA